MGIVLRYRSRDRLARRTCAGRRPAVSAVLVRDCLVALNGNLQENNAGRLLWILHELARDHGLWR
jgi:hypothetical protein